MLLRFVLVGLVTGLGCNLSGESEVVSWARAGRDWVQARLDDATGARLVADRERADAQFAGIVDDLARDFTADLASLDRRKSPEILAFDPIEVPDDVDAGVAFALNRGSEGEGREPEAVAVAGPRVVAGPATVEPATGVRPDRLASAVRLTRQAALAWLTVLRDAPGASPSR